jgi:hypothetical protein
MAKVIFDDSDFQSGMNIFQKKVERQQMLALEVVADELLRLSQLEVPFDIGFLMQSGNTEPEGNDYLVGYNTPYAARLHENPQFKFKNRRKGKYLEDPLKKNRRIFLQFFNEKMGEVYG